jgi:RimJ/RimL family protein N-acetyltransferase
MPYPVEVETPNLLLRRWLDSDATAVAAIWADPAVRLALRGEQAGDPEELAAASHRKQLRHWAAHGFGLWIALARDSGEVIGWIGAWYPDFVPELEGEIEIGWTLRRSHWGRGLATEGARAAVATAFEHLTSTRLISLIAPENHRSAAVATRLGMIHHAFTATRDGLTLRVFALPAPAHEEPESAKAP